MYSADILKEEHNNLKAMKKAYIRQIKEKYSWGYSVKKIGSNEYIYRMKNINGKVIYKYQGRVEKDSRKMIEKYKQERKQLKIDLSSVKQEMKFIERVLRYAK